MKRKDGVVTKGMANDTLADVLWSVMVRLARLAF